VEVERKRRKLRLISREARIRDPSTKVFVSRDKLVLNGSQYSVDQLNELPVPLQPISLATRQNDNYFAFGGPLSDVLPNSNLYEEAIPDTIHLSRPFNMQRLFTLTTKNEQEKSCKRLQQLMQNN